MADRSLSPSPNKSHHLERGVFSSISTISLYKNVIEERKQLQSNSLINIKMTQPKTPIRTRLLPSPKIVDRSKSPEVKHPYKNDDENSKLQESIKKLQQQLMKEKRNNERLEEQIKEITAKWKSEVTNSEKNVDKVQKNYNALKANMTSLTIEKDSLQEKYKKTSSLLVTYQEELKSLINCIVLEISQFISNVTENYKEKVLKHLRSTMNKLKTDLKPIIIEVEKWKCGQDEEEDFEYKDDIVFSVEDYDNEQRSDSLASTRGFNTNFLEEIQSAVALYDFEKEREEDVKFKRGDIIEILEKNESGWWIGRVNNKIGTFPFNFVNII
ncbi:hypothetical protein SteCoe_22774 [Stentor coeruleus]|uniref:SH3 domain-containing protein n=1 Tax=Stentor coeruleus TaxID=5963 RepID=A0A1R2BM28_9CILI|nr:hypothetical protein SteCoe_22774 [Stentor coeruleus]